MQKNKKNKKKKDRKVDYFSQLKKELKFEGKSLSNGSHFVLIFFLLLVKGVYILF